MWPFDAGETQPTIRLYENMELRKTKSKVRSTFVVAPKLLFAWHRIREYQTPIRVFGALKGYHLILDNRSGIPISPYSLVDDETLSAITDPNAVATASHDYAQTENEMEQHKSNYYNYMGLGIMGMVICFIIVVIILILRHKAGI